MRWIQTTISLFLLRFNNRREFTVINNTRRLGRRVMGDRGNGLMWEEDNHYSKVVIIFLVKNLHRLESITLLCRKGLAADAVPLLRGMYEELVDLKYMSADRTRVNDFVDYDTYQRYKLGRALLRSTAENIDRERVEARSAELEAQWERIKPRFTYRTASGEERLFPRWTQGNVREIADQVKLGEMYDYLFGYLSAYVHSSPITADDFVLGRSGDSVVLTVGASPNLVPQIAATSSGIYLDMLRLADTDFEMNIGNLIEPVEEILRRASAARRDSEPPEQ